jgi:ribosomal protein L37AE/L43A
MSEPSSDPEAPLSLQRPASCPECGNPEVIRIIYGKPTVESMAKVERGEATLGGCFIEPWLPDWQCGMCRHKWFVAEDPAKQQMEAMFERILSRRRTAK